MDKKFDIICLGRAGVDLYANQVGARLEDVQSFSKYIGGSSCNIAYGCARLGLKSSMLTRVGNEHMGRFIRETLEKGGVDVSHVKTDKKRFSGLVILGIKDQEIFPLIFYRNDCADMAISLEDFTEEYIASSKALLITGTHFSTAKTSKTCQQAMSYAKKNQVKLVLDIDYRPVLWGLTGIDQGEERFIKSDSVSTHLQSFIKDFDLIVGTEEEFQIAGGNTNIILALKKVREITKAVLVLKRGALGNSVIDRDNEIPNSLDDIPLYQGVKIDVLNVLGAGDAFMSGFLRGWLNGEDYETCSLYANACGALVVSRHGCSPAIPSWEELQYYIDNRYQIKRIDKDKTLNFLHKVTNRSRKWRELFILAFDHRWQFEKMLESESDEEKDKQIKKVKAVIGEAVDDLLLEKAYSNKIGVIVDGKYGQPVLNHFTGKNIFLARPLESSHEKKDFSWEFANTNGSIGSELMTWPQEQVVKCFVKIDFPYYTEEKLNLVLAKLTALFNDSLTLNRDFLLELLVFENGEISDNALVKMMQAIYQRGIKPDWWKLFPTHYQTWQELEKLIAKEDKYCEGVLLLGNNASYEKLKEQITMAKHFPMVKGFAIGRSVFYEGVESYFSKKIDGQELKTNIKEKFKSIIKLWQEDS